MKTVTFDETKWQLVPKGTRAIATMLAAWVKCDSNLLDKYKAMLAAAPEHIDEETYPVKDPTSAETLAPLLWNAYKDILNDEALTALRDVIENQDWSIINFSDDDTVFHAFCWNRTTQGVGFWCSVDDGKYNKRNNQ